MEQGISIHLGGSLEVNDPVIPEPGTTVAGLLALLPFAVMGVRKLKENWSKEGATTVEKKKNPGRTATPSR